MIGLPAAGGCGGGVVWGGSCCSFEPVGERRNRFPTLSRVVTVVVPSLSPSNLLTIK